MISKSSAVNRIGVGPGRALFLLVPTGITYVLPRPLAMCSEPDRGSRRSRFDGRRFVTRGRVRVVPLPQLTISQLQVEAIAFAAEESRHAEPSLFGVTDGKAVGTYLEQKFRAYVATRYDVQGGNSAKGIDLPGLNVDIKVTSEKQPQSSCPFKSARQKVFGLGYSLLVFVYDKHDDATRRAATLSILHTIFIEASATGDYTMTKRLREMVNDHANLEDIMAYLSDRNLPVDEIEARNIAEEILRKPPPQGYLTISNALQWRLQYGRAIQVAGTTAGVFRLGGT